MKKFKIIFFVLAFVLCGVVNSWSWWSSWRWWRSGNKRTNWLRSICCPDWRYNIRSEKFKENKTKLRNKFSLPVILLFL